MYESCSIISNNYIFLKSEVIFLNVTNRSLCKKAKAIHVRAQNFLYKIRIYHPFPPENVPQKNVVQNSLQNQSVIWCWLQELICSCADVIPICDHDDDDAVVEDLIDNSSSADTGGFQENNNRHDFKLDADHKRRLTQTQRKEIPNVTAVLKTVCALIALDINPHHQNVTNLQQQHDFQVKLQQYQKKQHKPKQDDHGDAIHANRKELWDHKRHCILLEEEEEEEEEERHELEHGPENKVEMQEQKQFTATCTKEQMMRELEMKSNIDPLDRYDNNKNQSAKVKSEICSGDDSDHQEYNVVYHENVGVDEHNGGQQLVRPHKVTASFGNLYRHCKLKTFQKIKRNLITHHGNNHCGPSEFDATTTLQTIVETDNDVISGCGGGSTGGGLYQVIDEKYNNELSLKVISSLNESSGSQGTPNKYQLLELPSLVDKSGSDKSSVTTANSVSKRIEFFEHANIPNGGIIKPKSNIYSIYRVSEQGTAESSDGKLLVKNVLKEKEAGSSIFMLRHDSHTLTIILSCVFIVTFLLLVFFPIPG